MPPGTTRPWQAVPMATATEAAETGYVALLRGVNVGPHHRLAMADLRAVLAGLGHGAVSTHLNSGNALFTSARRDPDAMATELERALDTELGLRVRCLVRDRSDLARVVAADPLRAVATDPARYLVTFLSAPPDPARFAALDLASAEPERLILGEREYYTWHPAGVHRSKLDRLGVGRALGDVVATARNWNTVTALLAKLG